MDRTETEMEGRLGWPLTFGGVAMYSRAKPAQWTFRFGVWAAVCAAMWVWSVHQAWVPGIEQALSKLPENAAFRAGRLAWPTPHPIVLANDHFLSLIVNPGAEATVDRTADLQIELGVSEIRCRSFLGWVYLPFPKFLDGDFGRDSLLPWWGAWKPSLLIALALIFWLLLSVSWITIGSAYTGPALMLARLLGRPATISQVWRGCAAAMVPGQTFVTIAVVAYACNRIGILLLFVFWAGHWVLDWIYLVGGIVCLSKAPKPPESHPGPNPFGEKEEQPTPDTERNPFRDPGQKNID